MECGSPDDDVSGFISGYKRSKTSDYSDARFNLVDDDDNDEDVIQ